jgi:hypothetical protein
VRTMTDGRVKLAHETERIQSQVYHCAFLGPTGLVYAFPFPPFLFSRESEHVFARTRQVFSKLGFLVLTGGGAGSSREYQVFSLHTPPTTISPQPTNWLVHSIDGHTGAMLAQNSLIFSFIIHTPCISSQGIPTSTTMNHREQQGIGWRQSST